VLDVHRIPFGIQGNNVEGKRPVCLVQHGFVDASVGWLLNTPQESLGFFLADQGCDVWLPNSRGNSYSNVSLSYSADEDKEQYWAFSFDEFASYDLPACIQYILNVTGADSLSYIGVSQGTTSAFAGFSTFPEEMKSKLNLFVAMAPIVFMSNVEDKLLKYLAETDADKLLQILGIEKFYPTIEYIQEIAPELCDLYPTMCEDIFHLLHGDSDKVNQTAEAEAVYMANEPDWTSTQEAIHYAQMIRSGKFQKFDWGKEGNLQHYGALTPPEYDLKKFKVPTAIFYGENDTLADTPDVMILLNTLPPETIVHVEEVLTYTHTDFNWSIDAFQVLYPKVWDLVVQYSQKQK